jgi:hypothetical protein
LALVTGKMIQYLKSRRFIFEAVSVLRRYLYQPVRRPTMIAGGRTDQPKVTGVKNGGTKGVRSICWECDEKLAMVMAGGLRGRPHPLTATAPTSAVPFGAKRRIIDFVVSNLVKGDQ